MCLYLLYAVTLIILLFIMALLLNEEQRLKKGITQGLARKYWILRERRRFIRFNEDIKIRYTLVNAPFDHHYSRLKNLSRRGLCVSTYEKLKEKDMLEIELELPSFSKLLNLKGEVVWTKEARSNDTEGRRVFNSGIKLCVMDPESEAILLSHLNMLKQPSLDAQNHI